MKRLTLLGLLGVMATLLAGCPIFPDGDECVDGDRGDRDEDCSNPPNPPGGCSNSLDCQFNETCGSDNECHSGDCTIWGCASGECVVDPDTQTASCGPTGGTGGAGGSGGAGGTGGTGGTGAAGGAGGGGTVIWCGNPADCPSGSTCGPDGTCKPGTCDTVGCIHGYACEAGQCIPTMPGACGEDADCAALGTGYACVSGVCTAPADQCSDQTQCPGNDKCVDGKCTPACSSDADCDGGFKCDVGLGVCTVPDKPCTVTNDCGGPDFVCVAGACVPRSDMGSCPPGDVWVENGCISNQTASFVCAQDGVQDACAVGSICLHHSCYISCASPNEGVCNLPSLDVCKSVTTSSGNHQVCGSNNNLGSECDPTVGLACDPGKICIDGFCK
jgi:hypothetical protein